MTILRTLVSIFVLLMPLAGKAELNIEIVGGAATQIPIAIVPFSQPTNVPALAQQDSIASIIGADLRRSGMFRVLETRGVANQPHDIAEVKYAEWAAIQAQGLTVGSIESLPGNRLKVSFRLLDVLKQNQLAGLEYTITPAQLRTTAHKIADVIYQKMTGEMGVFATRIAYISKANKRYSLQVADADGYNPQTVVSSNEPIISPSWSPDGTKLAYVSFEKKKPVIYVQSLVSGQRYVLANFKGNNSAPSWSPDGKKLAIVLTYGANSQIYTINADGTGLQSLTKSSTIDTEPVWSSDAVSIYFTSDRGGSPQIYRVASSGGDAKRVTFEGSYIVSPRLSADGKSLAYIRQDQGKFRVAIQDIATGQVQILSDTSQDEAPSFAPNGRMILYATTINGKGTLAAVSADGRVKQRLSESGGDVREPAWGPAAN
ncbi:MAG: Tol-Pal system beta propeller repeat protein TolB [Candidatus Methylopumilus sp.]